MGRAKKKARVQKRQIEEEEEEQEDEEKIYEVEVITSARVTEDGDWEYFVKWHGYDSDEDSWLPDSNLGNCTRLLKAFWKEVGVDNEDYHPGYVTTANDAWIERERKRAQREFAYDKKGMEKRAKRQRDEISKAAKKADKSTDFIDDEPLPKKKSTSLSKSKGKTRSRTNTGSVEPIAGPSKLSSKRKRGDSPSDSESESESDASSSSSEDAPLVSSLPKSKLKRKSILKNSNDSRETSVSTTGRRVNKGKKKGEPEPIASKASKAKARAVEHAEVEPATSQSNKSKGKEKDPNPAALFSDGESSSRPPPLSKSKPSLTRLSIPESPTSSAFASTAALPGRTDKFASSTSALPPKPRAPLSAQSSGPASAGPSSVPPLPGRTGVNSASSTPNIPTKTPAFIQQQHKGNNATPVSGGIPVKQRVFQMALTLQNPKEQFQGTTKKPSLSGLNFKKQSTASAPSAHKPPSIPSQSPVVPNATVPQDPRLRKISSAMPPPAISPTNGNPTDRIFDSTIVSSPIDDLFDEPQVPDFFAEATEPLSAPISQSTRPQTSTVEADSFLNSVVLPSVESNQEKIAAAHPPGHGPSAASMFLTSHKISKKRKWTGKIEWQRGDEVETLCEEAVLTDATQVVTHGMPFIVAIPNSVKSLQFRSFLQLDYLDDILLACKPVQQLARLNAEDDVGKKSLNQLTKFMACKQLCVLVPVLLDGRHVAQILFFPPEMTALTKRFHVPLEYRSSVLIAALLPWALDSSERLPDWLRPYRMRLEQAQNARTNSEYKNEPNFWQEELIRRKPVLKHAIRILEYPHWLHSYMSFAERTFAIWSDEKRIRTKGLETDLLRNVLRQYNETVEVSLTNTQLTLKAVFIHVTALHNLSKLPKLIELRSLRMETMFILYGTSPYDPHIHWGFHEIYPIGGILTFTASALVDDTITILEKINEVDDHKLWLGYLIPSVLGMAVRLQYRDQDPFEAFDNDKFMFHFLLTAIDEGKISLMRAPPQKEASSLPPLTNNATPQNLEDWKQTSEKLLSREQGRPTWKSQTDNWVLEQTDSILRGPREILEYCIGEFGKKYDSVPEAQWQSTLEAEISGDLGVMQLQPAIMYEYRRFVVLKAERDQHIKWDRDGFEWLTCNEFKFRDQSDEL